MSLPRLTSAAGQPRLLVDDEPFLILGLQWDCDSCFTTEAMNYLFPHAARMGANTAALPTYWREIEPRPGEFDFTMVDERIQQARAHNLRLVLLWFATWKNGCPFYAPDDVRDDPQTYRRGLDRDGQRVVSLCPTSDVTWGRDRDALIALVKHLKAVDDAHTVIMLQVENEPGLIGTDRCYCTECNRLFAGRDWAGQHRISQEEAFSVVSLARYMDRLAGEAKAIYPLPVYINVWNASQLAPTPGHYPSGGAVWHALDLFREQIHFIDMVSPDIYGTGYHEFRKFCETYSANSNPLYIAEHSSSPTGRAEHNVFYAIGQHGAIGFDPWSIDSPFPDMHSHPLVDPIGEEWGPQAYSLRDSYVPIGRAMIPIAEAQRTKRLFTFVQESMEGGTGWSAEGCDILISYHHRDHAARGMIIQQSASEFLLIGVGFSVFFRQPGAGHLAVPVRSADWGRFEGRHWVTIHPMRREHLESTGGPVPLHEPSVTRIILDKTEVTS